MDINTHVIFPLGETAAAIRGENELWLAMVLRNKLLLGLKPAQLAAVCGSLVSEGIKLRPSKNNRYSVFYLFSGYIALKFNMLINWGCNKDTIRHYAVCITYKIARKNVIYLLSTVTYMNPLPLSWMSSTY